MRTLFPAPLLLIAQPKSFYYSFVGLFLAIVQQILSIQLAVQTNVFLPLRIAPILGGSGEQLYASFSVRLRSI